MWSIPDPRLRWRWAIAIAWAAPAVAVAIGIPWAMRGFIPVIIPTVSAATGTVSIAVPPFDPQVFQGSWWRPFSDQAVPDTTAPPPTVSLFAVMQRHGVLTVALDFGPTDGLHYLTAGQRYGAVQVVAVDAKGASCTINGVPQRFGAAP